VVPATHASGPRQIFMRSQLPRSSNEAEGRREDGIVLLQSLLKKDAQGGTGALHKLTRAFFFGAARHLDPCRELTLPARHYV